MGKNMSDAVKAVDKFDFEGEFISLGGYGSGHINDTYLVTVKRENEVVPAYILQRINNNVFPNVSGLMDNMVKVTRYLKSKHCPINARSEILTLVPTKDNNYFYLDDKGDYWRSFVFVDNSISYDFPETPELFKESAQAFGRFARDLENFEAERLNETIVNFHNNEARFEQLKEAAKENKSGRKETCLKEIEFVYEREEDFKLFNTLHKEGKLPLKVTHNDTKLNNVLFDKTTGKSICVIDLDTVMPGFIGFDFGDAIRFGGNTALEDEKDLSKVEINLEMFKAYAEGFLSVGAKSLNETEIKTLPMGAKMMTLECGSRFLADYLNGDTYFKTAYPEHNLVRARNQFKLVKSMEENWEQMENIIEAVAKQYR